MIVAKRPRRARSRAASCRTATASRARSAASRCDPRISARTARYSAANDTDRSPHRDRVLLGQAGKILRSDPEVGALGEESAQVAPEPSRRANRRPKPLRPARAPLGLVDGVALEEFSDDLVFIAAGEQLRRLGTAAHFSASDDLERERRERTSHRTRRRPVDRHRERIAQRRGRTRVGVSTRTSSGSTPASTRARTRARSVEVLPDPGAPTTAPLASGAQSTTTRCSASNSALRNARGAHRPRASSAPARRHRSRNQRPSHPRGRPSWSPDPACPPR